MRAIWRTPAQKVGKVGNMNTYLQIFTSKFWQVIYRVSTPT